MPGRVQEVIDAAAESDIRAALLMVADSKGDREEDPLDAFARAANNAAATCGTPGTAGGDGLDVCVAQCERKPSFLAKAPHDGACYMLCSLAVAPCAKG